MLTKWQLQCIWSFAKVAKKSWKGSLAIKIPLPGCRLRLVRLTRLTGFVSLAVVALNTSDLPQTTLACHTTSLISGSFEWLFVTSLRVKDQTFRLIEL